MITETAVLNIVEGKAGNFEAAFNEAQTIISGMKGYIEHELLKCIETENKYLLIVRWETLEDHTIGFRESEPYQYWKKLLHHFYSPFPAVEHFLKIN